MIVLAKTDSVRPTEMFWFILFVLLVLVVLAVYRRNNSEVTGRGEDPVQPVGEHPVEELVDV